MSISGGIVEGQGALETVNIAGKLTWLGAGIAQGVKFLGLAEVNTILTIALTFISILYGGLKLYEKFLDVRDRRRRHRQEEKDHNSKDAK